MAKKDKVEPLPVSTLNSANGLRSVYLASDGWEPRALTWNVAMPSKRIGLVRGQPQRRGV
jgi:hypothetical protein